MAAGMSFFAIWRNCKDDREEHPMVNSDAAIGNSDRARAG